MFNITIIHHIWSNTWSGRESKGEERNRPRAPGKAHHIEAIVDDDACSSHERAQEGYRRRWEPFRARIAPGQEWRAATMGVPSKVNKPVISHHSSFIMGEQTCRASLPRISRARREISALLETPKRTDRARVQLVRRVAEAIRSTAHLLFRFRGFGEWTSFVIYALFVLTAVNLMPLIFFSIFSLFAGYRRC